MSYIEFDKRFNSHRRRMRRRQRLITIMLLAIIAICLAAVVFGIYLLSTHYIIPWLDGPRVEAAPIASGATVTIAPQDTLWHIARKWYPDMDPREAVYAIRLLNPEADPGRLQIGQVIVLPEVN